MTDYMLHAFVFAIITYTRMHMYTPIHTNTHQIIVSTCNYYLFSLLKRLEKGKGTFCCYECLFSLRKITKLQQQFQHID